MTKLPYGTLGSECWRPFWTWNDNEWQWYFYLRAESDRKAKIVVGGCFALVFWTGIGMFAANQTEAPWPLYALLWAGALVMSSICLCGLTTKTPRPGGKVPRICETLGVPYPGAVPDVRRDMHRSQRWAMPWNLMATDDNGKKHRIPYAEKRRIIEEAPPVTWEMCEQMDPEYTEKARALARAYGYEV